MRKITNKEKINGMKYCTFCKPHKVDAVWRSQYRLDNILQLACNEHKYLIEDGDKIVTIDKMVESEDYSEADYQTWLNI